MTSKEELVEREGLFARMVSAFMQRDFGAFRAAMREDVVFELQGSSPLAGTHRGYEDVGRHIVALREVLRSAEKPIAYLHEGQVMVVRHDILVHGPLHEVEMPLRITVTFDRDGRADAITVEPEDQGLFDHVVRTSLGDPDPRDAGA